MRFSSFLNEKIVVTRELNKEKNVWLYWNQKEIRIVFMLHVWWKYVILQRIRDTYCVYATCDESMCYMMQIICTSLQPGGSSRVARIYSFWRWKRCCRRNEKVMSHVYDESMLYCDEEWHVRMPYANKRMKQNKRLFKALCSVFEVKWKIYQLSLTLSLTLSNSYFSDTYLFKILKFWRMHFSMIVASGISYYPHIPITSG